jgi:predicted O-methyltransferase YrrM
MIYGMKLAEQMKAELPGDYVACKVLQTYDLLDNMVVNAGHGDYLEIGTWRGASAVVAAKAKKRARLSGNIVCVDPFTGYNNIVNPDNVLAQCRETLSRYNVSSRVEIVIAKSRPFPAELEGRRFTCAFIDGDHWGENPYLDFLAIKDRVDGQIMFDDHDVGHPEILEAVKKALTHGWKLAQAGDACAIIERINNG